MWRSAEGGAGDDTGVSERREGLGMTDLSGRREGMGMTQV